MRSATACTPRPRRPRWPLHLGQNQRLAIADDRNCCGPVPLRSFLKDSGGSYRGVSGQPRIYCHTVEEGFMDEEERDFMIERSGLSAATTGKLSTEERADLMNGSTGIGEDLVDLAVASALDEALGFVRPR